MSSHSISASVIYKNQRRRKTGHCRMYKTNLLNLVESKLDCKRNCYVRKETLRDTQIRSKHEMGKDEVSANTTSWWVLDSKIKRTSRDYSTAQFPIAADARTNEFYEQFWRIPGYWIRKIVPRFHSTWNDFEFSCVAQPRQKIAAWHMESIRSIENVLGNQISTFDSPWDVPQRISSHVAQRNREAATGGPKVKNNQVWQVKTGKIIAQFQCRCLRQDRWLRSLNIRWNCRRTTWSDSKDSKCRNYNSTGSVIPHHSWCGKPDPKHRFSKFSDFPSEDMSWIKEVEMVGSFSRSVYGKDFPNFKMQDAKISSALNKIIQNSQFKKMVSLEEQKAQKEDRFLRGRQIALMIYDYFRVSGAHDTAVDYADFFSVDFHDDDIREFDTRWNEVLLWMSKISSDDISESLAQNKTVLELDDMEIHQKISMPNCQKLKTMVKRRKDQKLRLRSFDARHGRIKTGAVVKNRKGTSGVEGGKGTCCQWKEKAQCSKGDRCSFRNESNDRAQKPEDAAATPSEPFFSRGRSVSKKKKDPWQKWPWCQSPTTVQILFEGTCTRSPCESWHPPECQFY